MKRNDIKKLATLEVVELTKKLEETIREAAKARLEKQAHKATNVKLAASLAKDVARIKTVLREKGTKV